MYQERRDSNIDNPFRMPDEMRELDEKKAAEAAKTYEEELQRSFAWGAVARAAAASRYPPDAIRSFSGRSSRAQLRTGARSQND